MAPAPVSAAMLRALRLSYCRRLRANSSAPSPSAEGLEIELIQGEKQGGIRKHGLGREVSLDMHEAYSQKGINA